MNLLTEINHKEILSELPGKNIEFIRYNDNKEQALKYYKPLNIFGQSIGKIANNFYFVFNETKTEKLVEELLINKNIPAIGVVDNNHNVLGVISRSNLFDNYSKPFGREIYKNKYVEDFIQQTKTFNFKKNIFSVSNEINNILHKGKNNYFTLVNDDGKFAGIFSSKDLLIHLSEITQQDINLAKKLQSYIVKEETHLKNDSFELLGATRMAKGIGGDFYSFEEYTSNKYFISLCDVSGKGISASLLSVIMSGMISIYNFKNGINGYISYLNSYIYKYFRCEKFITGVFIDFDYKNGDLNIYDAGHSYIYLYRSEKFFKINSQHKTIPLGIDPNYNPQASIFKLVKDDLLILMTDGIADQINAEGETFGIEKVFKVIKQNKNLPLNEVKNIIFSKLMEFRNNQTQSDDISLVMVKF